MEILISLISININFMYCLLNLSILIFNSSNTYSAKRIKFKFMVVQL